MIFLGLKVIGFIIGYGFFFLASADFIGDAIKANYFGIYTEQAKWIILIIPTAGVIYLISWILLTAWRDPKCQHCGKKLLDDKLTERSRE